MTDFDIICDTCKFQGKIDCNLNKSECKIKTENKNKKIMILSEKPVKVITDRDYYCGLHEYKD
jgi:hypothetical protein